MNEIMFYINSIMLGVGLAMDAFSVSLANGLNEPDMKKKKLFGISGLFAFFQALMPIIGYFLIRTVVQYFQTLEKLIPWIALILLLFIGIKMLIDGIKKEEDEISSKVGFAGLILQAIATSIDALSVGCTIADYQVIEALVATIIIGLVTFIICSVGVFIGKQFGNKISNKATIFGGIILIIIGIEIFLTGLF